MVRVTQTAGAGTPGFEAASSSQTSSRRTKTATLLVDTGAQTAPPPERSDTWAQTYAARRHEMCVQTEPPRRDMWAQTTPAKRFEMWAQTEPERSDMWAQTTPPRKKERVSKGASPPSASLSSRLEVYARLDAA